jgi:hypothetical protein
MSLIQEEPDNSIQELVNTMKWVEKSEHIFMSKDLKDNILVQKYFHYEAMNY